MSRTLWLCCAAFTALPAPAQSPDATEQARAVETIRQYALNYAHGLPDFMCTQVTTRTNRPNMRYREVATRDTTEEQLRYTDHKETYTVLRINGIRPVNTSHDHQMGIWSSGEFGTLLSHTMDPKSKADLQWKGTETVNGHRTWIFSFRVPQQSGYGLVESSGTILVPYEGTISADPETGIVYRIDLRCDIPQNSEFKQLDLTLDYRATDVSGREFVLPAHFHLHTFKVVRELSETVTDADYNQYRRFTADSSLTFDGDNGPRR